jgi:phosphate transport system substrate-binding protein
MKWLFATLAVIAALVFLSVGLGGSKQGALIVVGSTSIGPFAELEAQAYEQKNPGRYIDILSQGSSAGLQAARKGVAGIGMCSRELTAEEQAEFQRYLIARDGLAIIVHPSNPVESLTLEQIRRLFAGDVANWQEVGGDDRPVRLITREEGSGTREAFQNLVMKKTRIARKALTQESNGSVKELVRGDRAAIGYMSLGLVGTELKTLRIDSVPPTTEAVLAGRYPLVRPFLFVTRGEPTPAAKAFIDYVLSPEGQKKLEANGLVPTHD